MRLFVLLFCVVFNLNTQEINKLDEKGLKHGLWKGYHKESNRLRFEGNFNHGKEIGLFKFFDDTKANTVIATREFSEKEKNSCYTIFYNQSGNKVSEGKVINKLFEGEWKYYHFNSPEIMTLEFYKNGKLEGIRKVFYKNGTIAEETTYKNGKKEGAYKSYAENGIILEESIYKNDVYEGLAVFKNANNVITGKGLFKNGKKIGIWEVLENGKLVKKNMNYQSKKFVKKPLTKDPTE
jgi:antitoxin component YwqK of YwqJK toxin-antitoxin module